MTRAAAFAGLAALLAPALGGCHMAILDPAGPIAEREKSLILLATGLMLIVVVPVIAMTLVFAWRYRASNTRADFRPDWAHSSRIEMVVWLVPCAIILVLGWVTWTSTHELDPYRPIASRKAPLDVEVVSLDWKWLFIYPQLGVASVNELAMPAGTPVNFRLTSGSVMNSFFIPRLGSQVYTMAGMQTKLSLLANRPGDYDGISANYSGGGFSDMDFKARSLSDADFQAWVAHARAAKGALSLAAYRQLAQPSEKAPVAYYSQVDPMLFHDVLNKCADGSACPDSSMKLAMARRMPGGAAALGADKKTKGL